MYKLTEDIEAEMQRMYPDVNIKMFVHHLFSKIIEKTLQSGACTVRELGKYVAYKTHSNKLGRLVIRIKFKFSPSFVNIIRFDKLLLDSLPIQAQTAFNESHEKKCSKTRHRRIGHSLDNKLVTSESEHTKQNLVKSEIMKILEEGNE